MQEAEQEEQKHEEAKDEPAQEQHLGAVSHASAPNVIGNVEEVSQEQSHHEGAQSM